MSTLQISQKMDGLIKIWYRQKAKGRSLVSINIKIAELRKQLNNSAERSITK